MTSVYAERFPAGLPQVGRELDGSEWSGALSHVHERFDGQDVRRSAVVAAFGPPSPIDPGGDASPEFLAIAARLRAVDAEDPSTGLR
ncbi:hypothetical protein [Microbispora sp. NPDC049125]|uniref:hypothetical protein n=1 Tax=Microbispora sp. NPDC049125 TaxID=3154929 RepID=UPI0034670E11